MHAATILSALAIVGVTTLLYFGASIRGSFASIGGAGGRSSSVDGVDLATSAVRRRTSEIQDRIDRAMPGAVIEVEPGTYLGSIDFRGRPIVLRARDGAERTVIDGSSVDGPVVTIRGVRQGIDPRLEGFTVRGGRGARGTGILVEGCDPIIARCRLVGNESGGAWIAASRALFDECEFSGNRAAPFGGGLQSIDASPVLMSCIFEGNSALTGGGAAYLRGGSPMIARTRFIANRADSGAWGGGVFSDGAELVVIDSEFVRNGASDGGGALHARGGRVRVDRCAFEGNSAGAAWALGSAGAMIDVRSTRFCGDRDSNLGDGVIDGPGNEFDAACARDCNRNGVPDSVDIALGHAEDCNRNGLIDECEIVDGTAVDADHDLIPDDCGR